MNDAQEEAKREQVQQDHLDGKHDDPDYYADMGCERCQGAQEDLSKGHWEGYGSNERWVRD